MVNICRVSMAVARKWIPTPDFKKAEDLMEHDEDGYVHVTNCIFRDAVEAVARLWLKAWKRFRGRGGEVGWRWTTAS